MHSFASSLARFNHTPRNPLCASSSCKPNIIGDISICATFQSIIFTLLDVHYRALTSIFLYLSFIVIAT